MTSTTHNNRAAQAPYKKPGAWAWVKYYVAAVVHSGLPITNAIFRQKAKWTAVDMSDQTGKVVLVTGANSGTGYETAKAYYEHGAKVYLGCRSVERATAAIADIEKGGSKDGHGQTIYTPSTTGITTGQLVFLPIDLGDLASVEAAARTMLEKEQRLDILFANAGIMALPPGEYTKQGYSLQFGTNVVGHQRLLALLLPLLKRTSLGTPATPARVVFTSSFGHMFAPKNGIDYGALKRGETPLGEWAEYGASKWGNIALAKWVDAHHGPRSGATDGQLLAYAVHPGMVATDLYKNVSAFQRFLVSGSLPFTPKQGALNQLYVANLAPAEAVSHSGDYAACTETFVPPRPDSCDPELIDKLWNWCEAEAKRSR